MPTQLPRVNVVVTREQHALLSELARLDPERSASGFLRELLDQVTPLLRTTVPLMRAAAEELDTGRESLREPLRDFMAAMQQMDLLDPAPGPPEPQRSEDGRTKRSSRGRR